MIKVKRMYPTTILPEYATEGAACFDIRANTNGMCVEVGNGDTVVFSTGLMFEIPTGYAMLVYSRSGHGFTNCVRLSNCVGVIDSDYRGELKVKLTGDFQEGHPPLIVKHNDRIAQAMLVPTPRYTFTEVEELSSTVRGESGLGSTGSK